MVLSALMAAKATAASPIPQAAVTKPAITRDLGKLPMSFEENRGQADENVRFLSRGNGYGLYLTAREAILALHKPHPAAARNRRRLELFGVTPDSAASAVPGGDESTSDSASADSRTDIVGMQLAGANPESKPVGLDLLPGTVNYFLGNNPANWRAGIPTYSKIRYSDVYPGVDLVYYGNQQQLEYDFIVAPGADPNPIRLKFNGHRALTVAANGDLVISAQDGSIVFHRPLVYQSINSRRKLVAGGFKTLTDGTVGFSVGRYDHSKPLVIDPILAYSTFFGGSVAEFVVAVTSDSAGSAYVTGLTVSEDFPLTAGAFQSVNYASSANAVSTAFISKFNPSGTALLYSTYLGGVAISNTLHEQGDYGKAIAVDVNGDAYVTGYTYSADFPVTSGAYQKSNVPAEYHLPTGFVTKLNPAGTGLIYSTFLGGSVLDELTSLTIDSEGDSYISGLTFSADFPTTAGVIQTINKSYASNGFNQVVSKLNPTGSALIYSTYLGGATSSGSTLSSIYWTNPIVVDKSGNAYVAGFTNSADYPVTSGAYQTKNNGGFNITISKLNPTATELLYSTYLGGSTDSVVEGLVVDGSGNAYVAGYTSDTDFPVTKGAFQTTNRADTNTSTSASSNQNGFLSKLNPTGTGLVYSTYLGGTTGPWGGDQIYDLALDAAGDAYVAGSAMSDDFPVTSNAYQPTNKGATHCCDYDTYTSDGFLTEINPAGTALIYSTYLGGSGTQNPVGPGGSGDSAYGLALGVNGSVLVVGFTTSPNFPVTAGAFETAYHTQQNTGFVADFDLGAVPTTKDTETSLTPSVNSVNPGTPVTFTATVAPVSGSAIPTGNMVFSVDESKVATVALNSAGKATYSTSTLPAGEHYILASYGGNGTYAASGSGFNEIISPVTPVMSPPAGIYTSQQNVTISEPTRGAVLYYTTDGTTPSRFSPLYQTPITVNLSKTIETVAVAGGDANSTVVSNAYTIVGSPSVLAGPATSVGTTSATVSAFVNTNGLTGSYVFRYGTSKTSLSNTTARTALSASKTRAQISLQLSNLKARTSYYYQVAVTTGGGTCSGAVLGFTTN
jgi:hypothetical protein